MSLKRSLEIEKKQNKNKTLFDIKINRFILDKQYDRIIQTMPAQSMIGIKYKTRVIKKKKSDVLIVKQQKTPLQHSTHNNIKTAKGFLPNAA